MNWKVELPLRTFSFMLLNCKIEKFTSSSSSFYIFISLLFIVFIILVVVVVTLLAYFYDGFNVILAGSKAKRIQREDNVKLSGMQYPNVNCWPILLF